MRKTETERDKEYSQTMASIPRTYCQTVVLDENGSQLKHPGEIANAFLEGSKQKRLFVVDDYLRVDIVIEPESVSSENVITRRVHGKLFNFPHDVTMTYPNIVSFLAAHVEVAAISVESNDGIRLVLTDGIQDELEREMYMEFMLRDEHRERVKRLRQMFLEQDNYQKEREKVQK